MPQQVGSINLSINTNANTAIPRQVQQAVNSVQRYLNNKPLKLSIDTKGLGNLQKFNNLPLGKFSKDASEFEKSINAATARVVAFGAAAGSIFIIERALKSLVTTTIDVEKQFTDIKVVFNATDQQFKKFTNSLFDVSRATATSLKSVNTVAQEFARQGFSIQKTLQNTQNALNLTRTSGLDLEKSVQVLTSAYYSFNNEISNTTDIVDKLLNVDTKFAVSTKDLAEGISRVGATASSAKVNFNDLLGAITALQQRTQRGGAIIGNALKTIFTRVQSAKNLKLIENLGISTQTVTGNIRPVLDILKDLAKRYDTLSDSQRQYISTQLSGLYQINQFNALLKDLGSSYSVVAQASDAAANSVGTAQKRIDELNKTASAQIESLKTTVTELASTFGNLSFGSFLKGNISNANSLLKIFSGALSKVGTDNEDVGTKFAEGIVSGFGNYISGPGTAVFLALFAKLASKVGGFALSIGKDVLGVNSLVEKQAGLNQAINNAVKSGNQYYVERLLTAKSIREQEEAILALQRQQAGAAFAGPVGNQATVLRTRGFNVNGGGQITPPRGIGGGSRPRFAKVPNYAAGDLTSYKFKKNVGGAFDFENDFGKALVSLSGRTARIGGISTFMGGQGHSKFVYEDLFKALKGKNIKSVVGQLTHQGGNPLNPKDPSSAIKAIFPQLIRGRFGANSSLFVGNNAFKLAGGKDFDTSLSGQAKDILNSLRTSKDISYVTEIQDAIGRERAAGVPANKIRVGYDSRVGVGIYNTRDEPLGLSQGVDRAIKEGKDPKKYGVPNFASSNDDASIVRRLRHDIFKQNTLSDIGQKASSTGGNLSSIQSKILYAKYRDEILHELNIPLKRFRSFNASRDPKVKSFAKEIVGVISGRVAGTRQDIKDRNFDNALTQSHFKNFGISTGGIGNGLIRNVASTALGRRVNGKEARGYANSLSLEQRSALQGQIDFRRSQRIGRLDTGATIASFGLPFLAGQVDAFYGDQDNATGKAARAGSTVANTTAIGIGLSPLARGLKGKAGLVGLSALIGGFASQIGESNFQKEKDERVLLNKQQNREVTQEQGQQLLAGKSQLLDLQSSGATPFRIFEQKQAINDVLFGNGKEGGLNVNDPEFFKQITAAQTQNKDNPDKEIEAIGKILSDYARNNRSVTAKENLGEFFSKDFKGKSVAGNSDLEGKLQNTILSTPSSGNANQGKLKSLLSKLEDKTIDDVKKYNLLLKDGISEVYEKGLSDELVKGLSKVTDKETISKVVRTLTTAVAKAGLAQPEKVVPAKTTYGNNLTRFGGIDAFASNQYFDPSLITRGLGAGANLTRTQGQLKNIRRAQGPVAAQDAYNRQLISTGQGTASFIQNLKGTGLYNEDQINRIVGPNGLNNVANGNQAYQKGNAVRLAQQTLMGNSALRTSFGPQYGAAQKSLSEGNIPGAIKTLQGLRFNDPADQEQMGTTLRLLQETVKSLSSAPDSAREQANTLLSTIATNTGRLVDQNDDDEGSDVSSENARGHIPSVGGERKSISRGIGGARKYDQAYTMNSSMGRIAVNTGEKVIPNFMGSGKPGIFNRDMIPNFALNTPGAKRLTNKQAQDLLKKLGGSAASYSGFAYPGKYFVEGGLGGSRRATIAHELFHAKGGNVLGKFANSETLANFVGGYHAKAGGTPFGNIARGVKSSSSFLYDYASANINKNKIQRRLTDQRLAERNIHTGGATLRREAHLANILKAYGTVGSRLGQYPGRISSLAPILQSAGKTAGLYSAAALSNLPTQIGNTYNNARIGLGYVNHNDINSVKSKAEAKRLFQALSKRKGFKSSFRNGGNYIQEVGKFNKAGTSAAQETLRKSLNRFKPYTPPTTLGQKYRSIPFNKTQVNPFRVPGLGKVPLVGDRLDAYATSKLKPNFGKLGGNVFAGALSAGISYAGGERDLGRLATGAIASTAGYALDRNPAQLLSGLTGLAAVGGEKVFGAFGAEDYFNKNLAGGLNDSAAFIDKYGGEDSIAGKVSLGGGIFTAPSSLAAGLSEAYLQPFVKGKAREHGFNGVADYFESLEPYQKGGIGQRLSSLSTQVYDSINTPGFSDEERAAMTQRTYAASAARRERERREKNYKGVPGSLSRNSLYQKKMSQLLTKNAPAGNRNSSLSSGRINNIQYTPNGIIISSTAGASGRVSNILNGSKAPIRSKPTLIERAFSSPDGVAFDGDRVATADGFIGTKKEYEQENNGHKDLIDSIEKKADEYNKNLAKKFGVSNFANDHVSAAKRREVKALQNNYGLSAREAKRATYVGFDPRVGVGVANRIDEPNGLHEGVSRVMRQGLNPRKYRGGSVSNFATVAAETNKQTQNLQQIVTILQNFLNLIQTISTNTANNTEEGVGAPAASNNVANITVNASSTNNSGSPDDVIEAIQNALRQLNYRTDQLAKTTNTTFAPITFNKG